MKLISRTLIMIMVLGLCAIPAALATIPAAVEDQSHMQEALVALQQARHHLEAAIPDKEGNRSAAIQACDEAIHRTQAGIQYWKEHQ